MSLGESKLQLIDLLGLAQLKANKRDYNEEYDYNKKMMELQERMQLNRDAEERHQEARKKSQMYTPGESGTTTIAVPYGQSIGGMPAPTYQQNIGELQGMVSGGGIAPSQYATQVHEGLMQTGRLMSDMAQTAAKANAEAAPYANQPTWQQKVDFMENQQRKSGSTPGQYPLQEQGMKQGKIDATILNLLNDAQKNQQKSYDNEYDQMAKDRKVESQTFDNTISDIQKQRPADIAMEKEIDKTTAENTKEQTLFERATQLQNSLTGDPKQDKDILPILAKLTGTSVEELIMTQYYKEVVPKEFEQRTNYSLNTKSIAKRRK